MEYLICGGLYQIGIYRRLYTGTSVWPLSLRARHQLTSSAMSDPLTIFTLAIAAAGGRVDAFEAQQLVAAGLTLKQRSVALVKALAMGRSALLLSGSPAFWVALAASDGSGALLIDTTLSDDEIAWQLSDAKVCAVFSVASEVERVGGGRTLVLLDEAPFRARVISDGRSIDVDLGSHHGLELAGDQTAEGRDEECVLRYERAGDGAWKRLALTHRALLASARARRADSDVAGPACEAAGSWSGADELIRVGAALLSGMQVTTTVA